MKIQLQYAPHKQDWYRSNGIEPANHEFKVGTRQTFPDVESGPDGKFDRDSVKAMWNRFRAMMSYPGEYGFNSPILRLVLRDPFDGVTVLSGPWYTNRDAAKVAELSVEEIWKQLPGFQPEFVPGEEEEEFLFYQDAR